MPSDIAVLIAVTTFVMSVIGGVVTLRAVDQRRRDEARRWYKITWPRDLAPDQAMSFLNAISGLPRQRWPFRGQSTVVFEITSRPGLIEHRVGVPAGQTGFVINQLRAHAPSARIDEEADQRGEAPFTAAAEIRLSNADRELRSELPEATSAGLLSALQPVARDECVIVQWIVAPGTVRPIPEPTRRSDRSIVERVFRSDEPPEERTARQAARTKQTVSVFNAVGRIAVSASTGERAGHLLWRVLAVLRSVRAPGVTLQRRYLPQSWIAQRVMRARTPLLSIPARLNARELLLVLGWPLGSGQSPNLTLAGARQLPPSRSVPTRGFVVATATYPGAERPLALSVRDASHHTHVIGPTGVGKSTLLANLILQQIAAGHGLIVCDAKGDLINDVVDRIPADRIEDVVVLDPTDETRPVGLNPLHTARRDAELVADQVVGTFHRLYAAFWGPRTQDILHASLLTLASRPGMTLCELPVLLTNAGFRRDLVGGLRDDVALRPFWAWYEALSDGERAQALGPVMNKLRVFLLRRRLRNVVGQAEPHFTVDDVLTRRKVLLVSLAKGTIGSEAAGLLGALVLSQAWQAIQRRTAIARERRAPAFVALDEFQDYLALPVDLGDMLAQARGFGVGLTLAHQHLGQLSAAMRQAVMNNARSRVVFQAAAEDASALARALGDPVTAADLQSLPAFEVYLGLSAGGHVTPPASALTAPLSAALGTAERVRSTSRERYGIDRSDIEGAIKARRSTAVDTPVGRRRRQP
jgi:hypothetical protein